MSDVPFTDEELEQAITSLTEPGRFEEAEARVAGMAPALQRILGEALASGGWFGEAHDSQIRSAAGDPDEVDRVAAVRTLLAEETRVGMLVGVAVGWELARQLDQARRDGG
jgi:hypothetical protein